MNTNVRFTPPPLKRVLGALSATASAALLLSSCASLATVPDPPTSSSQNLTNGFTRDVPPTNLYVANTLANTVTVYSTSTGERLRTISQGVTTPKALAFDSLGNLYVLNRHKGTPFADNNVSVYKPGGTSPSRVITKKICHPSTLSIGSDNKVYVGNGCLKSPHRGRENLCCWDIRSNSRDPERDQWRTSHGGWEEGNAFRR